MHDRLHQLAQNFESSANVALASAMQRKESVANGAHTPGERDQADIWYNAGDT